MNMKRLLMGFFMSLTVWGCSGQSESGPTSVVGGNEGERLRFSSVEPHEELANLVAVGLRDPGVRNSVLAGFRNSRVVEGKVYLRSFIGGDRGGKLRDEILERSLIQASELDRLVSKLPPLEVYIPVPDHRKQWKGESSVIVASTLEEEAVPYGVDLEGNAVALSLEAPPSVPTIVITPVESFTNEGLVRDGAVRQVGGSLTPSQLCEGEDCGGSSGGWTPPWNAVWRRGIGVREFISHMRALNDHEPWTRGAPEFYLLLAGTSDTDSQAELTGRINIPEGGWAGSDDTDNAQWRLWSPQIVLVDWDIDYGTRVRVQCMEEDGTEFNASITVSGDTDIFGVNVQFSTTYGIENSDDNCGQSFITPRLSNGQWTLIPDGPGGNQLEFDGTSDLQWYGYGLEIF